MNRYDLALGKKPNPSDCKKRQRTHQDPEESSGLFHIGNVVPIPMQAPVGLAYALRTIYVDENDQSEVDRMQMTERIAHSTQNRVTERFSTFGYGDRIDE
jgi:hypothetical protein